MQDRRAQHPFRLAIAAVAMVLLALPGLVTVAHAAPVRTAHVEAELIAEKSSVRASETFDVGVRLKMKPKWHTYWINPGDTGLPTKIVWRLPEGFQAGETQWPHPRRLLVDDLVNFGYEDEVLLISSLTPPASLAAGKPVTLQAHVSWLVCEVECVPEQADLTLTLPSSSTAPVADARRAALFSAARSLSPGVSAAWKFSAEATPEGYRLIATPVGTGIAQPSGELYFFSQDASVVDNKADQPVTREGERVVATLRRAADASEAAPRLRGMWVAAGGWQAGRTAAAIDIPVVAPELVAPTAAPSSLLTTLLLALVGGLILNLMPCVFPVLGLKILGFVDQAGENRRHVVLHGLMFTAGVLLSFWILAALLALLRAGGEQLGWGFQLQSPLFVYMLAALLLVFALNLSGVWEFGVSATTVGGSLHTRSGLAGTFFTGFLATVVATPCSAPFLAPALGAAVSLPIAQSFVVFTVIGVGLSLPYLLLSVFPSAVRLLPRPGRWMETFKQVMAFPLYATVVYLVWVLAGQISDEHLLSAAWGLILVAMGVWVYGRWTAPGTRRGAARLAVMALVLLVGGGLWLGWPVQRSSGQGGPPPVVWEKWSPERVAQLQAENRIIYVDFTARWCATCQTNKQIVFHSDRVLQAFAQKNVATLRADWTNSDPQITAELAKFQRSAIPFNLIYKPGSGRPVELPTLLTPELVLREID